LIDMIAFARLFAVASGLIFRFGRFHNAGDAEVRNFFRDAFYGDGGRPVAKYVALVLTSIASHLRSGPSVELHATHASAKRSASA
jgi:hypothetical protein